MRMVEMVWNEDEEKFEQDDDEAVLARSWKMPTDEGVGVMWWKEHTNDVLEVIDDQLAAFGLEVVQYDTRDDPDVVWRITKRAG